MQQIRNFTLLFFIITALCGGSTSVMAQTISTQAEYALIMDYETGEVLFDKNADKTIHPASMSKLMTAAFVFDKLQKGELDLERTYVVSEDAWRVGNGQSEMFVLVGEDISIHNLLTGLIVSSGNDAAMVLAENISGSEAQFAAALNDKAREWGLYESHFANAAGLPDGDHYMTLNDLAKLTRLIIRDYPEYMHYFGQKSFEWSGIEQQNRNILVHRFNGSDGMKTGHAEEAGYGIVGTAMRDGQRRIIILHGLETKQARAREALSIMESAFTAFAKRKVFTDEMVLAEADVYMGNRETVGLKLRQDISFIKTKRQINGMRASVYYNGPLRAPLRANQQVAILRITFPNGTYKDYPLYTTEKVNELGVFAKIGMGASRLLTPPQNMD